MQEVCVLNVGKGGDEKLMAVIVPDMEYFHFRQEVTLEMQIRWDMENFAAKLPSYQRVLGFVITPKSLPRTRLGKLQRFLIKKEFTAKLLGASDGATQGVAQENAVSLSAEDLELLNQEHSSLVLQIFERNLKLKRALKLDDHLELDLGLDSLRRMEIFADLEKSLKIKLTENMMAQVFTVRDLLSIVASFITQTKDTSESSETKENLWQQVLQTKPPQELLRKITFKPQYILKGFVWFCDGLSVALSKLFLQLEVHFEEPLPKDKAFILCANHNSYLDGALVRAAVPWGFKTELYFFIQSVLVRNVIAKFFKLLHIIPISPVTALLDAFRASAHVLKAGKVLVVFPEGMRSIDGNMNEFKSGIGIIAKELDMPIMPVYIQGAFESWPRSSKLPRPHKVELFFGKLVSARDLLEEGIKLGAEDDYMAIAQAVRARLCKRAR